ncbi:unnamed protein product [Citrullus colocynthis]|uniref:H15 domain-containing protein n=1 Tax=Citrullus colocynthis TaxID=252529 RepID=A0ABP0YMG4_9ROSI
MSSTGEAEVKVPAEDVPPVEVPAAEEPKEAEKPPVKEKKPRAPREKKPRQSKVASHPPYFQMINEAISSLNEKNGSSPYAIAKYMEEKHKAVLPANFRKILALQLKNSTAKGKLTKIKASYKLSETGKKKDKNATKVAKANAEKKTKQARTTRTTGRKRKAVKKDEAAKAAKKVVAKKPKRSTTAKPKQPKSIKAPAAKRAKKAVAGM